VKFVHQGVETTLQCGDGQERTFVGTTRLTFQQVATCRVIADGKKTVVTVRKAGTSSCAVSGDRLRCSSP
jgi:hypothetical protein